MKEIYNKDFQCEISQEEADKIREEMRKAPVIEMKVKNEDEVEFTMLQVKSYEVKEFLDKLQKEYIPTSKIKAKIEEAKKSYNDLHTKHLRDCGIAEQRELAKIEFGQSLLEKE